MAYGDAEDMMSPPDYAADMPRMREMREAEALLAALVAFSRDAIMSSSLDGTIETWNEGAQRLFGWSAEEAIGQSALVLVPDDERPRWRSVLDHVGQGHASQLETELVDREGRLVQVNAGVAPVRDRDGTVIGFSFIVRDLRRRRRSEANDAMLASVARQSGDSIFSVGRDGLITSWNPASERLYGYTREEAIGRPLSMIVPDSKLDESAAMFQAVMRGEEVLFETVRERKDSTLVDVAISGAPLRDAQGAVIGISSIHRDNTVQRQHEQQMRLVMRELAHRSKNLLAIIISMAGQTARNAASISDFIARFTQRLQGIAHSHDLLVQQNWRGAPIRELILSHLEPFLEGDETRVHLSGDDMVVDPKAAQNIGLALHELATNASKYGALSQPAGYVKIAWRQEGDRFIFDWRDVGGPLVMPPQRRGFGQTVLERLAAQALEGKAALSFNPEGVHWRLDIPQSYLVSALNPAEWSLPQG